MGVTGPLRTSVLLELCPDSPSGPYSIQETQKCLHVLFLGLVLYILLYITLEIFQSSKIFVAKQFVKEKKCQSQFFDYCMWETKCAMLTFKNSRT